MKTAQYCLPPPSESIKSATMRTAFVTGGTGFVGGHVARALLADGWRVRLLTRDASRATSGLLEGLDVEPVVGDLSAAGIPGAAIQGADAIVHLAGLTKARRLEDYREVNLRGTERLLDAAGRIAPGALFVLISSQAAAGPARSGRPVRDSDAARPISWYGLSKREGEDAVERQWKGGWHVIRPGVVYGPGDRGLLQYFQLAARGLVPIPAAGTWIQIVGVERAALAIARAAARPELSGRRSFLCDPDPITIGALARAIAAGSGRRARFVNVPDFVVRGLGLLESGLEGLSGRSRPFNADKAREVLAGDWLCDGSPLDRDLALLPGPPLEAALREAWAWYASAGWIRGPRGDFEDPRRGL